MKDKMLIKLQRKIEYYFEHNQVDTDWLSEKSLLKRLRKSEGVLLEINASLQKILLTLDKVII